MYLESFVSLLHVIKSIINLHLIKRMLSNDTRSSDSRQDVSPILTSKCVTYRNYTGTRSASLGMQELSNRTSNDPRSYRMLSGTHDRPVFPIRARRVESSRSKWNVRSATVELQALERPRCGRSRACEIKNHDDDAIDRLFRATNRYSYRGRYAYRGMLFPRSDTKYITARRTTWTDRTLELETWVIKVPKDNWPVSKGDSETGGGRDLRRKMSAYRPKLQAITRTREEYPVRVSGPREAEPRSGNTNEFSREPYGTPGSSPTWKGGRAYTHAGNAMGLEGWCFTDAWVRSGHPNPEIVPENFSLTFFYPLSSEILRGKFFVLLPPKRMELIRSAFRRKKIESFPILHRVSWYSFFLNARRLIVPFTSRWWNSRYDISDTRVLSVLLFRRRTIAG